MLNLSYGLRFTDLHERDGLLRLDAEFMRILGKENDSLRQQLVAARNNPALLATKDESELLIALAPHVDDFVGGLFNIRTEVGQLSARHNQLAPLYSCKRLFVQRKALHKYKAEAAVGFDGAGLKATLTRAFGEEFSELAFANHVTRWLATEENSAAELDLAQQYAAWAVHTPEGRKAHVKGVLFKVPHKLDHQKLVQFETDEKRGFPLYRSKPEHLRRREGFSLTDQGTDLTGALDQAHYCIWCHEQGKDSCSKGLKEKGATGKGAASFKKSPFGVTLAGCPLEEKISEFHKVKTEGHVIGALAVIIVDNPMLAATGHRICNDCMKACIYQKQEPVDIPQAETRTLKDVLELPWGFEIYSLLTRWNPLNIRTPYPKAPSGKRVLVIGMGPAGFTLAHFLMNDGHTVVGIDGLKIEPLQAELSGVDAHGGRANFEPIQDIGSLHESLDARTMAGFGGVAEYGITVRWDKNFLKLIRLLLERRRQFALFGGVRFGGTITLEDAFAMGFDHVALAIGAGKPTVLDMPNGLARGVRTASDFLMALQLTGAAKKESIANMQLRLPVVVIGGGLTAIDTATESLAYYPVQVEKFLARYETLLQEGGESKVRLAWNEEEREVADEFLEHARAIRGERAAAEKEGREPDILSLLRHWGGVTIAYRRRMVDSPSYTLNHEEVQKALEEGIWFAECLSPTAIEVDAKGLTRLIRLARQQRGEDGKWSAGEEIELPARSVLVAAGTQPNTVLAREDAAHFPLDGKYFRACDEAGNAVKPEASISKPNEVRVLLAKREDGRFVSYFGDVHPSFFGNVVKAMGGAKQGYPIISRVLSNGGAPAESCNDSAFIATLNTEWRPTVHEVVRLTPNIVEIVVRAPQAARSFQPGQFYRLQNFETLAPRISQTTLNMEGLALTGAWVDKEKGLVSTIVLEMGGSSSLCAELKAGEPIVLMGPTGSATEIPVGETVALVGGGLGNAVLFSIGQALRRAGSKVLYFAGYKKVIDRYKVEEIEAAADVVVWCCDEAPGFVPGRPQDRTYVGNIVQAIKSYAIGNLGNPEVVALKNADRVIAIGSDRMMAAVAGARHTVLKPFMKAQHFAIGSINSPMQCMMKEICAQCLQPHRDPQTGKISYVFSCFNQDQPLDQVDWPGLDQRLKQNSAQEKLTAQWISRCTQALKVAV